MKRHKFLDGHKANFETLKTAASNGDLVLMDCKDAKTKARVAVVCAVWQDAEGQYNFVPLARMFNGNPYKAVIPPE